MQQQLLVETALSLSVSAIRRVKIRSDVGSAGRSKDPTPLVTVAYKPLVTVPQCLPTTQFLKSNFRYASVPAPANYSLYIRCVKTTPLRGIFKLFLTGSVALPKVPRSR